MTNLPLSVILPGAVLDGVTLQPDSVVLLTAQTNAVENGLYRVTESSVVRATDLPANSQSMIPAQHHVLFVESPMLLAL